MIDPNVKLGEILTQDPRPWFPCNLDLFRRLAPHKETSTCPPFMNEIGPWLTRRVVELYDDAPRAKDAMEARFYREAWSIRIDACRRSGGTFLGVSLFAYMVNNTDRRELMPVFAFMAQNNLHECHEFYTESLNSAGRVAVGLDRLPHANMMSHPILAKHIDHLDMSNRVLIVDNSKVMRSDSVTLRALISGDPKRIAALPSCSVPRLLVTIA